MKFLARKTIRKPFFSSTRLARLQQRILAVQEAGADTEAPMV